MNKHLKAMALTLAMMPVGLLLSECTRCGTNSDTPVPRPAAYHRIAAPAAAYDTIHLPRVAMAVNTNARLTLDRHNAWITIVYPFFGSAKAHLSVTPVDAATMPGVVGNRTERMALNAAGGDSELTTLRSAGGWECTMMLTRAGSPTPVQILAVSPRAVLSGAFTVDVPSATDPDSIRPIVEYLAADALQLLKSLRND